MSDDAVRNNELRRIRLFLQLGEEGEYRYLAWFGLKGSDFYWGPARPGPDIPATPFSGVKATIEIPQNIRDLPNSSWKASRHESGVLHINSTGTGNLGMRDVYVGPVTEITQPQVFAALLDKHPEYHPPYTRSLTRDKSVAMVIRIPDDAKKLRHYFEFYLTPAGTFQSPKPVISLSNPTPKQPFTQSLDIDLDIIFAIQHYILGPEASGPNPDVGFWLTFHSSVS